MNSPNATTHVYLGRISQQQAKTLLEAAEAAYVVLEHSVFHDVADKLEAAIEAIEGERAYWEQMRQRVEGEC